MALGFVRAAERISRPVVTLLLRRLAVESSRRRVYAASRLRLCSRRLKPRRKRTGPRSRDLRIRDFTGITVYVNQKLCHSRIMRSCLTASRFASRFADRAPFRSPLADGAGSPVFFRRPQSRPLESFQTRVTKGRFADAERRSNACRTDSKRRRAAKVDLSRSVLTERVRGWPQARNGAVRFENGLSLNVKPAPLQAGLLSA